MLSKYFSYLNGSEAKADTAYVSALISPLSKIGDINCITPITPGGTLGVFFMGTRGEQEVFIKTHHPNECARRNLLKEYEIMSCIYCGVMEVECVSFETSIGIQNYIIMPYIHNQVKAYTTAEAMRLVEDYEKVLAYKNFDDVVNYTEDDFVLSVKQSSRELCARGYINKYTYRRLCEAIIRYCEYIQSDRSVCHGDLSNVNIFSYKGNLLALDWEDALFNVPQYDILYWLTFFSQRKYYNANLFGDIGVGEQYGKDIMSMIIAVKSYMSVLNESYKFYSLSVQDRLDEIAEI